MRLRWLINRSASASDSSRAGGIAVTFVINAPLVRDIDRSTGCPFEAVMVPIAPLIAPLPRTYVTLIRTEHGASDLSMLEKRRGERETFDIETYINRIHWVIKENLARGEENLIFFSIRRGIFFLNPVLHVPLLLLLLLLLRYRWTTIERQRLYPGQKYTRVEKRVR